MAVYFRKQTNVIHTSTNAMTNTKVKSNNCTRLEISPSPLVRCDWPPGDITQIGYGFSVRNVAR